MDNKKINKVLQSVKSGKCSVKDAADLLKHMPYEDIGVAMVDHHRELRHGVPEVIFAEGKKPKDVITIAESMLKQSGKFLVTRATAEIQMKLDRVSEKYKKKTEYYERAGLISVGGARGRKGAVVVLSAGTSDLPVAEEAMATASFLGSRVESVNDVGVAGLHRLFNAKKVLADANVLIVVAGMEGALPSVIGGMTDKTIIAVPTSVGYGTSLGGMTALFAMLNSCVPGIAVMNIDNGFGAGVLAHKINMLALNE